MPRLSERRQRAQISTLEATDPIDHRAIDRIARRSGQTPQAVLAVLRALQAEVPNG